MKQVEKTWGWEHWFSNSKKYCGKLLFVRFSEWSSNGLYHYHELKDETFFVIEGDLKLEYYEDNIHRALTLHPYDSFHIKPGVKHRFSTSSTDGCKFIEASTEHFDDDSYRCELVNEQWSPKT